MMKPTPDDFRGIRVSVKHESKSTPNPNPITMGSNPLKNSSKLKAPSHPKQTHGPTAKAATFQHTPGSSASFMATADSTQSNSNTKSSAAES
ncbi:hypothetical protein ACLOJK_007501 [Asimina triloba]